MDVPLITAAELTEYTVTASTNTTTNKHLVPLDILARVGAEKGISTGVFNHVNTDAESKRVASCGSSRGTERITVNVENQGND